MPEKTQSSPPLSLKEKAVQVFGDPETACAFMAAPNFYLNYTSPDALIASSPQEGAARVEELLNAIEYGVYL